MATIDVSQLFLISKVLAGRVLINWMSCLSLARRVRSLVELSNADIDRQHISATVNAMLSTVQLENKVTTSDLITGPKMGTNAGLSKNHVTTKSTWWDFEEFWHQWVPPTLTIQSRWPANQIFHVWDVSAEWMKRKLRLDVTISAIVAGPSSLEECSGRSIVLIDRSFSYIFLNGGNGWRRGKWPAVSFSSAGAIWAR